MPRSLQRRPLRDDPQSEEYVCWSRMQAEAGQSLEAIVARKEKERLAGSGLFVWGVGNPPASLSNVLARGRVPVRAIFSVMKTKPRLIDRAPARTLVWRRYVDCNGVERSLPAHALVLSRGDSARGPKRVHYALMCYADEPLTLRRGEPFDPSAFRNVSAAGAPVGASQVTALLRRVASSNTSNYEANFSAWLTESYWVRLVDPAELDPQKLHLLTSMVGADLSQWNDLVSYIRSGPGKTKTPTGTLL